SSVLGMEIALSQGHSIKTGGKIVKNVTGYDLGRLFVGSRSWLGIPHVVHLRLAARPVTSRYMLCTVTAGPAKAISLANRLTSTGIPVSCMEVASVQTLLDTVERLKEQELVVPEEVFEIATASNKKSAFLLMSVEGQDEVVAEMCADLELIAISFHRESKPDTQQGPTGR